MEEIVLAEKDQVEMAFHLDRVEEEMASVAFVQVVREGKEDGILREEKEGKIEDYPGFQASA